ncbi:MAG: PspA/IM30 family protein [Candidatus Sericytochromatia bacterium]|nr:PspA/IM30 family protein [Candidatus Tanganyikabacteria bacterium]
MGFLTRLANLFKGILGLFIGGLEKDNPEAVYESAIQSRQDQYQKLMKAVSGIVYLRNKLEKELTEKSGSLKEIMTQIPVAVQQGEEQLALQLIEKKNLLTEEVERIQAELTKTAEDAEKHKQDLLNFQTEIEKLKQERDRMVARAHSAKARLTIQEQLSGMSVEADVKALDQVRESIMKTEAQADLAREVGSESVESKMRKIKDLAKTSAAAAELEQYKIQLGLSQPAAEADKSLGAQQARTEKTM